MDETAQLIKTRLEASAEYRKQKLLLFDKVEELFHNQLNDLNSADSNSQVFDPKLSTLTIERAYRVMAQLATGKVRGISTNDKGDEKLKNLLLDKYVVPNANVQFDFLTKLRMVDLYSNVYGAFYVLVDQVGANEMRDGYIGPDMWLLNIRDVYLQVGTVSVEDSDFVIIRTWRPISFFEGLAKNKDFKNIGTIIGKLKDKSGSKQSREQKDKSRREENQYPKSDPAKGTGYFECLTMYEKDKWSDYCVDADVVFREMDNPHENGEIPVVAKYSLPLLDDPMGLGDFERGASMQQVVNANWNLYLDAVKMSIFPPTIINKDNVASMSSLQPIPGAQWLGRNNVDNVARTLQLSPQGISTFNNTYQVATSAILNLFGTTETNTSAQTDPGFGKTPQALMQQAQRENTRDNADRFFMEQFVTKVMKKMVNLLAKKQSAAISFRMFPEEIEQLARDYPDIKEMFDENTGKLTIKKNKKSVMYDYEIVSGSTYANDQKAQQENLTMLLQLWLQSQTPQGNSLEAQLEKDGFTLKFGELFKRVVSSSGIQDWNKILEEKTEEEKADHILKQAADQFNQVLQQVPENMNGVPPMPGQQPGLDQMPSQPGQPPQQPPMGQDPMAAQGGGMPQGF